MFVEDLRYGDAHPGHGAAGINEGLARIYAFDPSNPNQAEPRRPRMSGNPRLVLPAVCSQLGQFLAPAGARLLRFLDADRLRLLRGGPDRFYWSDVPAFRFASCASWVGALDRREPCGAWDGVHSDRVVGCR